MEASHTTIGWIGTGVMGSSMCRHLMDKGYPAVIYNRSREKAALLLNAGARWAETPSSLAEASDVVFTMVGFPRDVRSVYFSAEGIFAGIRPGTLVIDMTTTEPSLAVEIYSAAHAAGCHALDAPVSGGDVGARNAQLSIMVGGDRDIFDRALPLFAVLGKNIVFQGPAGSGQHAKMCNQIVIAGTMIGMCESLVYGHRAGLNLDVMLASISGGAAACWCLNTLAPRILRREFDTGFFVEHFVKDMGIALMEAERMNLSLPGLALVRQLYISVKAHGGGRLGTQALMLALERMSRLP